MAQGGGGGLKTLFSVTLYNCQESWGAEAPPCPSPSGGPVSTRETEAMPMFQRGIIYLHYGGRKVAIHILKEQPRC